MSRSRRVAVALMSVLLTTALASVAEAAVIRGSTADGGRWRPRSVTIDRGDRVVWRAVLGDHNVMSYRGNWDFNRDLPEGTRVSKRFRHRGTFRFYCSIHGNVLNGDCSGMCGRVVVG